MTSVSFALASGAAGETASVPVGVASGDRAAVALDPISLATGSSGVVFVVLSALVVAAVLVWFIAVLKLLQLRRWARAQDRFEEDAAAAEHGDTLVEIARHHGDAPGARIVAALHRRRNVPHALEGVAKRAVVEEQKRAQSLMAALASIGSAAPFVDLFGTVWGIMDAFLRIGREKSASLPVVAPAIGEALIATAVGLFAAIPAVIVFNALNKRIDDLLSAVEASATGWLALVAEGAPARPSAQPLALDASMPSARFVVPVGQTRVGMGPAAPHVEATGAAPHEATTRRAGGPPPLPRG